MLCNWKLKNFKSVYEKTELELAPLTIFAGANSTGKSTIIQSILLVAQTLQNPVYSKSVILNGHVARFGTFNDLATNGHSNENIEIGFSIESQIDPKINIFSHSVNYLYADSNEFRNIDCEFSFNAAGENEDRELLQLQPNLFALSIRIKKKDEKQEEEIEIVRSKESIEQRFKELEINESLFNRPEVKSLEFEVLKSSNLKRHRRFFRYPTVRKTCRCFNASFPTLCYFC